MLTDGDHLGRLGHLVGQLRAVGVQPVLVGGFALVLLGSRRVTVDVDFVVSIAPADLVEVISVLYAEGFELASRLDDAGEITRTIDNPRVAASRIKIDQPESVFFLHRASGLRVDFLLDFPLPAADLLQRAQAKKVGSHQFVVASLNDLMQLKESAYRDRKLSTDLQDIEFLRKLLKSSSP